MASVPFHYLDLRTFSYETEDEARVETALRTFVPEDAPLDRAETAGHHGDRIVVLSTRLERADEMRHVLEAIAAAGEFAALVDEVTDRVDDDCAFFVRLDKQRAYQGQVALGQGIQLRGKVEAYPASRENAIANLREYFAAQ